MGIALITGASSGLGRQFALQLDGEGLSEIWLIARRKERLQEVAAQCKTPTRIIQCDLLKKEEIDSKITTLLRTEKPPISHVVNNAGFGKVGLFADIGQKEQVDMITLNCAALTHISHITIPYMEHNSIFFQVSSAASFAPLGGFAVYAATKAFVTSFSIALAAELKDQHIHSIAVCPGPTDTEFSKTAHGKNRTAPLFESKYSAEKVIAAALKDSRKKKFRSIYGRKEKFLHRLSSVLGDYSIARMALKKTVPGK
ncbi:MAG: SDR family NAD(P)-dependent oxidoreductase [Fibrobacterota bacterium]